MFLEKTKKLKVTPMVDFKNTNIRLLCINLFLLVTGFLLSDPLHWFESTYEKSPRFIKSGTKSDIVAIKITASPDNIIELKKTESGWSVIGSGQQKDYPGDNSRIEGALERLFEMRKYYEVSANAEKYAEFEVSDNDLQIELKSAAKTYSFILGKQGSAYNTSMVREKAEKTVYSVRGNLKSEWNQNLDYFRNKRLVHINRENINEVTISGPVMIHLKSGEKNSWSLEQGREFLETNPSRVNRLIDDISLLEGIEFHYLPQNGFVYGNIKILLKSNTILNIEINRIGNEYIIKSDQNPFWQKIPEFRIKSIFPELKEIQPGNAR